MISRCRGVQEHEVASMQGAEVLLTVDISLVIF
jgi:hypothetical protein